MLRPLVILSLLTLGAAGEVLAQPRQAPPPPDPAARLGLIAVPRGCPLASTTVALGVNRAVAPGAMASQPPATSSAPPGCRPLVSTQLAAGVNLALGPGSQAEQSLSVQGPPGTLATTRFSRGANLALGAHASASQRLLNLTTP